MRLVSFDLLRTIDIPGVKYIKPDHYYHQLHTIREADWVLFPEYWQVNSLVYGLNKRLFPSPSSYHLGHDKIEQTRALLTVAPQHVPDTVILPSNESATDIILERFDFPFVAKIVRSSMGNGVFRIDSRQDLSRYVSTNPILYIQEYLPIKRDLRVVWVGKQVLTAYWREQGNGFHFNVAQGGIINFNLIPIKALELVAQVATQLGIDHAGFDIAFVNDHAYILEFNILFGLTGLSQKGLRCGEHVLQYLQRIDNPTNDPPGPNSIAA